MKDRIESSGVTYEKRLLSTTKKNKKRILISVEIIVVINSKNCERLMWKVLNCSHL